MYITDPLEQFNILFYFSSFPFQVWFSSWDNISTTILVLIGLILILPIILFGKTQFNKLYFYLYKLVFLELFTIVASNLLIKKQIFIALFYTIFFLIAYSNIFGLVPFSVTVTSFFIVSLLLAGTAFFSCVFIGCYKGGIDFFNNFLPAGVPYAIGLGLVLIELISYTSRLLSLSIRLFANMMSGHTLIKILLGFTWSIFAYFSTYILIFSTIGIIVITFLEFMIAFLQAYIFVVLVAIYFNGTIHTH